MHEYRHHIGDFRGGTIHMSRLMRWLYRDMIEAYYDKEAPLPADLEALFDLIGAYEENEREAVKRVLRLKFTLEDDGYHHERCDAVVDAYKAAVAEGEARKANEAERQRRYRERRTEIFRILREEFDEVPEFDMDMKALRKLLETLQKQRDMAGTFTGNTEDITSTSQPVTRDIQVRTPDATAITINQEPLTINHKPEKSKESAQSTDAPLETEEPVDNSGGKAPAKTRRLHSTEEDRECAQWLFDLVLKVNPGAKPPSMETWGNDIRMMREIDERSHRQICELFRWAAGDAFWCKNIQSPGKLREKWDRLVLERGGIRTAAPRAGGAYEGTMAAAEQAREMIFGKDANHATE